MVNLLKALWALIEEFFATKDEVVPATIEEPVVVAPKVVEPVPNLTTVRNFALAIQSREGYIAPCKKYPTGTSSYRNNNPGNCKGINGKFLKFKTYEDGFAYLIDYIERVQRNEHKAYPKNCTIQQFFNVYAPESDGNLPLSYAKEVCAKVGLQLSSKMVELT